MCEIRRCGRNKLQTISDYAKLNCPTTGENASRAVPEILYIKCEGEFNVHPVDGLTIYPKIRPLTAALFFTRFPVIFMHCVRCRIFLQIDQLCSCKPTRKNLKRWKRSCSYLGAFRITVKFGYNEGNFCATSYISVKMEGNCVQGVSDATCSMHKLTFKP
jgi:hypothetical protein